MATLSHWDLRSPNIFAEKDRITSIIDWQDCWIKPLFLQERRPQLIDYQGDLILRLPDSFDAMEDKQEKKKLRNKVQKSIVYFLYGEEIRKHHPTLQKVFDAPLARKRRELVGFAGGIWDADTMIPLRESLHRIQQ